MHHALGLPTTCLNFDVANACLGFLNGMQLAAMMIDAGRIEYALVVDGEGAREIHEATLDRLARPDATREDVLDQFATLTLGSGAAAMVLGRADVHPEGHRLVGSVLRAATEHHELCVGDLNGMSTDTKGLLDAGMAISGDMWADAQSRLRLVGHGPLHRPPGLAGAHRRDVPDARDRLRPGAALVPAARQHGAGVDPVHPGHARSTRCRPATACC